MSERNRPHKGRDVDGRFRVRQADVDDLLADPEGVDYVKDDVRLGGAVADVGPLAGKRAEHIEELITDNRADVERLVGREDGRSRKSAKRGTTRGRGGR